VGSGAIRAAERRRVQAGGGAQKPAAGGQALRRFRGGRRRVYDGAMVAPTRVRTARDRAALLAETPRGYSPWFHLAFPNLFGATVIALCLRALDGPSGWQWSVVPAMVVVAIAAEWRFHRDVLHRRVAPFEVLYDYHTVSHHSIYRRGDMAIREARELRGILFPAWASVVLLVLVAPLALVVGRLLGRDAGLLLLATAHGYLMAYEWLHLAYHLPERLRGWWPLRPLARWHEAHHDPRIMQRANFGVTSPLWDWLRGTARRP
jgi:sterol desaturase/sphingolipid hydroxylase (fatty acid hydroxylase superfamily)